MISVTTGTRPRVRRQGSSRPGSRTVGRFLTRWDHGLDVPSAGTADMQLRYSRSTGRQLV